MRRIEEQPMFENCRLIFKNFSGTPSDYNREGDRNFCVVIEDQEVAKRMKSDGWNVKFLAARDESEDDLAYLPVAIAFGNRPPTVVMLTHNGRTRLDEDMIGMLDYAEIENIDLIVRPYNWERNGKSGVKAYTKSLYVTLKEDALARKYANIDTSDDVDAPPFDV